MAKDAQVVPVFVPPLATMLAHAEEAKGEPLTEAEVARARDHAVCIMMHPDRANEMTAKRGYRDVEPRNCWADWHRLRVQVTGKGYLPKIVLCLVGGADFAERAKPVLEEAGVEHEFTPRDERMAESFAASAFRVQPTLTPADYETIAKHESVLYILSKNYTAAEAPEVARTMLLVGAKLLAAGATAMKCESSGVAHSRVRWTVLAIQADNPADHAERCAGLFSAYPQYPIQSEADLYTCGMHLLGKPDLIAPSALMSVEAAVELFRAFAMYLLVERADGGFASGHTFSVSETATRYRVVWEPCSGYAEDDFFFNPFGRWRFTAV